MSRVSKVTPEYCRSLRQRAVNKQRLIDKIETLLCAEAKKGRDFICVYLSDVGAEDYIVSVKNHFHNLGFKIEGSSTHHLTISFEEIDKKEVKEFVFEV